MIRRITIGILNGIILFLPPHKRTDKVIAWLQGLLYPYYENETSFYLWRDEMIIRAKVTGQKMSLQWYLNYLYDPIAWSILIDDSIPGGTAVSLESEATSPIIAGLEGTIGEDGFAFYLEGEVSGSLPKDFRVLTPVAVDLGKLASTINLYNSAHKSYDIITF